MRLRARRPEQFHTLFGCLLGNRDGIDNWHQIPKRLRHSLSRQIALVRSGSGVIEKNIDDQHNWTHWWIKTALAKTKVNPVGLHPLVRPIDN